MGFVRIVGGTLRGRRLQVLDRGVRPTSERTREAIFDILGPGSVEGVRVLDLYAGTGALGTEALSRGASSTDFVERDRADSTVSEFHRAADGVVLLDTSDLGFDETVAAVLDIVAREARTHSGPGLVSEGSGI